MKSVEFVGRQSKQTLLKISLNSADRISRQRGQKMTKNDVYRRTFIKIDFQTSLRTVPTFATAHTFCASGD